MKLKLVPVYKYQQNLKSQPACSHELVKCSAGSELTLVFVELGGARRGMEIH
jgi:hypothetical protein